MASSNDEVQELFDELTLDELTDRAAEAHQASGGEKLSEAELAAAQDKAREIINETRAATADALERGDAEAGPLAGLQDMHALSLSIGLPAPRILFDAMVEASTGTDGRKKVWRRQIKKMSEVKETGCIKVDFNDTTTGKPNVAFLVLDECGPGHDLTAELDKIYSRIPAERQDEIRKHLSMLVYLGRSAYGQMMMKMMETLTEVGKKIRPADGAFDPRVLAVDPTNTTLFVPHTGDRRVGIFVRLSDEVEPPTDEPQKEGEAE